MITDFLIFPIHLFDPKILEEHLANLKLTKQDIHFHLMEEPCYFGYHRITMNFNKLKLVLHRASMKYYEQLLLTKNYKVTYHEFHDLHDANAHAPYTFLKKADRIIAFDPVDYFLYNKLSKTIQQKIEYLDSPAFLDTRADLEHFHTKINKSKSFFHSTFYKWQKQHLHILESEHSYDTENRSKLPPSIDIPPLPKNDSKTAFVKDAIKYIEQHFPNNYGGNLDTAKLIFPITHNTSRKWLNDFCKRRLLAFGKYEDAIDGQSRNYLFHSCISPMLNIGLLTPSEVLTTVTKYYSLHKKTIGIANYEGFIRQIIGWREYQRYIYLYGYDKITKSNYFTNENKLAASWYSGTTGIVPLDNAIKMAFNDGYIHHILRLMIVGNIMNLCGISPIEAYKWFMEFSVDSYDWVMIGNVYSMALWCDGGLTMRKPYISGDGYVMKMSSNLARGEWNGIWLALFYNFINTHQTKLKSTYYAGMITQWNRKTSVEQAHLTSLARDFIKRNTK
jgi:deoxyribodipyrimidine photolyase-related protein